MLRRGFWSVPAIVLAMLVVAACNGGGKPSEGPPAASLQIVPGNGARQVRPDQPVVVTVVHGTLTQVVVLEGTSAVPGSFSPDRRTWRTSWTLRPKTAYTVTAAGTGMDGNPIALTGRFTTLTPSGTFAIADVTPTPGETVGVGMPLIVTFDRPIVRRAAVERSLEVQMSRPVEGAWHWTDDRQVVFRPRRYWPTGQRITLRAHTAGVRAAPGVYGRSNHTTRFRVGKSRISTVDVRRHVLTVKENGTKVRVAPISAGKGGTRALTTTSGIHLTMGKHDMIVMSSAWMGVTDPEDPRYYRDRIRYAVRISSSGEFIHSAPESIGSLGRANISHGCINASPAFAEWFYRRALRGDVVKIIGTDRALEPLNGWGYWQIPWRKWVRGSALHDGNS